MEAMGLLTAEQSNALMDEIVSNYNTSGVPLFGNRNKDIRQNLYNYEHPICYKVVDGVEYRIAHGFIREQKKTYLLYANGNIIGQFTDLNSAKNSI